MRPRKGGVGLPFIVVRRSPLLPQRGRHAVYGATHGLRAADQRPLNADIQLSATREGTGTDREADAGDEDLSNGGTKVKPTTSNTIIARATGVYPKTFRATRAGISPC